MSFGDEYKEMVEKGKEKKDEKGVICGLLIRLKRLLPMAKVV